MKIPPCKILPCEIFILGFFISLTLFFVLPGCTSDASPSDQPIDDTLHGVYGKGSISFEIDSVLFFNVSGKYKPSNQFISDTASEGAGGFLEDTSLYRNKIQALLTGYYQRLDSIQYHLVVGLCDTSSSPQVGHYPLAKNNQCGTGRNSYAHLIWTDINKNHFFETYMPQAGSFTITSIDKTTGHIQGIFSGTFWNDADTTITVNITSGQFDIYLVNTFFNY